MARIVQALLGFDTEKGRLTLSRLWKMFGCVRLCSGGVAKKLPVFPQARGWRGHAETNKWELNRHAVQCSTSVACDSRVSVCANWTLEQWSRLNNYSGIFLCNAKHNTHTNNGFYDSVECQFSGRQNTGKELTRSYVPLYGRIEDSSEFACSGPQMQKISTQQLRYPEIWVSGHGRNRVFRPPNFRQ